MQVVGMGASGKGLVLFSRLTNGSIVTMTRVNRRIVGQDQELLGYAVDYLTKRFWTAGLSWSAGEQGVSRKQVIPHQEAS